MHIYNGKKMTIKLFNDKYIKCIQKTNIYNAKLEPKPESELEYESAYEPKFEEAIAEREKKTKKT